MRQALLHGHDKGLSFEDWFGTLKTWFGWRHFLLRGFKKVRGEMSLMVLGYNLTRVINILGLDAFRAYFLKPQARQAMAQ